MKTLPGRPPFVQFGLRGMLLLTAVFCVLFASCKAFGLSQFATLLVTSLLFLSLMNAFWLAIRE